MSKSKTAKQPSEVEIGRDRDAWPDQNPPFAQLAKTHVDEFISSTHGECNPDRYRDAMIEWHRLALEKSFIAGQEFANDNR